jgi:REP element-mobilizing transposase RayT
MVTEAVFYNSETLRHYILHAFVVMPNHVHVLLTAEVPLPQLTKSLKGITAKRANAMLALKGNPFWQEESYDHLVRHEREFQTIRRYIEENPVRAGLVGEASEYRWSSAGWATRGSAPRTCKYRLTGIRLYDIKKSAARRTYVASVGGDPDCDVSFSAASGVGPHRVVRRDTGSG